MVKEVFRLSSIELEQVRSESLKDLASTLGVKPDVLENARKAYTGKSMQDPDNFCREILTEVSIQNFEAKRVFGKQDIRSSRTAQCADGISAIFVSSHPLTEDSIKDNFHISELKCNPAGKHQGILAATSDTSAVIFKNQDIDKIERACYIANEAAHQIMNSRTTVHDGKFYSNIFHFKSSAASMPEGLEKLIYKNVPENLKIGISFKDRRQVHELISDCASVATHTRDIERIISNSLSEQINKDQASAYQQTNTFASRQAIRYLSSLPSASSESESQIRQSALIFLRARIKHGSFETTPYITHDNKKLHPADIVLEALGESGEKFIQQQYVKLGKALTDSIVSFNQLLR